MQSAKGYAVEGRDPDPRGMKVIGADRQVAGTVKEVWLDVSECLIRYLEVELVQASTSGGATGRRTALLPINFSRIDGYRREVTVKSILAAQFADVPVTQSLGQVTRREEDRICAYYGGGQLYATISRAEPML